MALSAGAWLGGDRSVLLMQSSGVGNCVNMLSLMASLPFPVPHAGDDAGRMGRIQSRGRSRWARRRAQAFEIMGVTVLRLDDPDDAEEVISAAASLAYRRRPAGRRADRATDDRPQEVEGNQVMANEFGSRSTAATPSRRCLPIAAICSSSPASARRPTTCSTPAIIPATSISGARWAARRWLASASRWRSRSVPSLVHHR